MLQRALMLETAKQPDVRSQSLCQTRWPFSPRVTKGEHPKLRRQTSHRGGGTVGEDFVQEEKILGLRNGIVFQSSPDLPEKR